MLSWNRWEGDAAAWDGLMVRFPDYTIYQCHAWGEHRSHFGWTPHRLIATENGETVAMAQVMARLFPLGVALAWVAGGPVGPVEAWGAPFRAALTRAIGSSRLYCRINSMREYSSEEAKRMEISGWRKPSVPILSGRSLSYSLIESEGDREKRASGNWRHNLRRSNKYGHLVRVWPAPDPDEMLAVYEAMQSHKSLKEQISRAALVSMLEAFGKQCIVVRCDDTQGRLLALRGALISGGKGWDIFAAATPAARKVYASHAAFWTLMRECASLGVRWYDMSGADPIGNKGVYDFKKGAGANDLIYLGEWDWATSRLLGFAANQMIKRRGGGM